MKSIQVGILGASGYTGAELAACCAAHPQVDIAFCCSRTYAGRPLHALYPRLGGVCDIELTDPADAPVEGVDCLFSCLPHAASAAACMPYLEKGVRVIDLSADFRIADPAVYKQWYKTDHPCPQYLDEAVYALSEHARDAVAGTHIVANPGCYATSVLLPLLPLYGDGDITLSRVVADAKSGVSGAGRALKQVSHFVDANENFSAYSIGRAHRHIAEIDQQCSAAAGQSTAITFSPHLAPLNRGILSTIYLFTRNSVEQCAASVRAFYEKEHFVRVRTDGDLPAVADVAHTNFCDIGFAGGGDGIVIAVSVIDNLLKGASGQALQNMNIMFGFDERSGLGG